MKILIVTALQAQGAAHFALPRINASEYSSSAPPGGKAATEPSDPPGNLRPSLSATSTDIAHRPGPLPTPGLSEEFPGLCFSLVFCHFLNLQKV